MWNGSLGRECLLELELLLLFAWTPKIKNQTLEKSKNPAIFHLHVGSHKTLESV